MGMKIIEREKNFASREAREIIIKFRLSVADVGNLAEVLIQEMEKTGHIEVKIRGGDLFVAMMKMRELAALAVIYYELAETNAFTVKVYGTSIKTHANPEIKARISQKENRTVNFPRLPPMKIRLNATMTEEYNTFERNDKFSPQEHKQEAKGFLSCAIEIMEKFKFY